MHQPPAVPQCHTPDEVGAYLNQLRAWCGGVSFHELTMRVNAVRDSRAEEPVAEQAIYDCFQPGLRRLDRDLVLDIARSMGLDQSQLLLLERVCWIADGRSATTTPTDVTPAIPEGREEFSGRQDLLAQAMDAVQEAIASRKSPVVVFTGPAGIGKTELMIQLAHRLKSKGYNLQKQCFVDLHGFDSNVDPSGPDDVLASLLRQVGVREPAVLSLATLDKKMAKLRQHLGRQPILLMFDNVANSLAMRDLLPHMPGSVVIATAQHGFALDEFATVIEVGPLDYPSCAELLDTCDRTGRIRREPELAAWFIDEICGRRPLDLVALGGQLADPEGMAWTLSDHANRLMTFRLEEGVNRVLAGSCERLDPETRRVFRLLGLFPGYDFTPYDIAILTDLDAQRTSDYLQRLHERNLLLRRSEHRYRLHSLVAEFTHRLLFREESTTSQRAALRRHHAAATMSHRAA
ncbi:MAG TPA: hypothetical protein VE172_05505 [Stackebrandtia sp.]|jgi:hypothetical protein|uniref:hypothetical protein n=1 Tax=Stackebrandtia sp. TaxID=2023065 RepID=UPI002D2EBC74|nr:hypothetical protein [Stackebrandtia sp.]HZE38250.1 hypothetical protein [Stackebrandtia sp.]